MLTDEDFPLLEVFDLGPGVTVLVTGRSPAGGGDRFAQTNLADHVGDDPDRVRRNRKHLLATATRFGARSPLVALRADHGVAVEVVGPPFLPSDPAGTDAAPERTDAAVTARAGVPLLAMAADCVPLALADPAAGVVGVVHAGWRGCAAGAAPAALAAMRQLGADPSTTRAYLGPAACGDCYAVGPEVVQALAERAGAADPDLWRREHPDGTVTVDLRAHLREQLVSSGVPDASIWTSSRCTIEDPGLFSHRRDGAVASTGRHGVLVVRTSA